MRRAVVLAVMLASLSVAMFASRGTSSGSTTIVVDPTAMNGWVLVQETATATGSFVTGPGTPPLGTGSAQMTTVNGTGGMILASAAYAGTPFSSMTNLEYSTYQQNLLPQAIALQFGVDYNLTDGNTSYMGRLVYEPYHTETVVTGAWQTWDPQAGKWWASNTSPSGSNGLCPMATPCTWAQVLSNWPNGGVHSTGGTFLKAGSGWGAGWTGNVDALTIGVGGNETTWDFEPPPPPCTSQCYVRTDGNDANPGTADTPALAKRTIQAAINQVSPGGTVHVAAGTYDQNLTITKSLRLAGAGQGVTIVRPGVAGANVCGPGSLCAGHSSAILIQASDVMISDLTVDGDNTTITSGVVVGGADIEARNGIIENHAAGVFNNTYVHNVTVQNIYLRGIQPGSGGSGFLIEDNTVTNVQGDPGSIAIFNFGGSGVIDGNTVTDANDGVAGNWSRGTTYMNNVVTSSGSGVHSDNNGGSGGTFDRLTNNTVTNCDPGGYGVWVFASYLTTSVMNNTVTNCEVGLADAGSFGPGPVTFSGNEVDGQSLANSTGAYVTSSLFGFGDANASAVFTNNKIRNNELGFLLEANPTYTVAVDANSNDISGNTDGVQTAGTGTIDADFRINWWGSNTGPAHTLNPLGVGNSVVDGIVYSPWLGIGTDASVALGFQPASPMTWMVGPDVCGSTCIQAAIDYSANGDTVKVLDGLYPEQVTINKSITVTQGSLPIIDGGGSGDVVTITADNVTLDGFEIRNGTNGVVLASGADNAVVKNNEIHTFTSAGVRGNGGTGADINNNTVTGPHAGSCVGGFWGIFVNNTSGSIALNEVSGIGNGLVSGCQEGRAIEANGAGTLAITSNNVSQYQKSGIIVRHTVNSTITDNTTTGEGATTVIAMNGITVVSSGTTNITGNHTNGHHYSNTTTFPETFSCGILYIPAGAASGAIIDGNDSTADEVGVCLSDGLAPGLVSDVDVTDNTIDSHRQRAIDVDGMASVLVDNNDIDGQGQGTTANLGTTPDDDTRYYGIFVVDSTGVISNNGITGIKHGLSNGIQSGVGIRATARSGGATDVDLTGNVITDIQKNAIVVTNSYGGTVNADITGNTTTGNGPVNYIAQNGIQVSDGATGTVSGNIISDYDYTPSTWAAAGILVYKAGTTTVTGNTITDSMEGIYVQQSTVPSVSGNIITGSRDFALIIWLQNTGLYNLNTITGSGTAIYAGDNTDVVIDANIINTNTNGIYIDGLAVDTVVTNNRIQANGVGVDIQPYLLDTPTGTLVNNNCIAGNTTWGMRVDASIGVVDAENNWWGRVTGPNPPGTGDAIDSPATIDATPFLTATTAGCPVPLDGDGDGVNDVDDNCPTIVNSGQENTNGEPMPLPKPIPVFDDGTNPAADDEGDACDADIDGDSVPNGTETMLGLSPYVWDTDGDRTNDGTEITCGSNPLSAVNNLTGTDSDNDRLPDSCEALYTTNPAVNDSDGDGVLDGVEVRYWLSNPLATNTDGDDCAEAREIASVNTDRVVNSGDLGAIAARFGAVSPDFRPMDSNGDGMINSGDLGFTASKYGTCTP